jgi:hypothetical protein
MERGERSKAEDGSRMTFTSGQCIKARQDDVYFAQCGHAARQK